MKIELSSEKLPTLSHPLGVQSNPPYAVRMEKFQIAVYDDQEIFVDTYKLAYFQPAAICSLFHNDKAC